MSNRNNDEGFVRWSSEVKQRDIYTCQICDRRGVELNAHHKNAWNSHPEERYDIDNGVTLCKEHHEGFHDIYGYGDNTKEQYEEYERICISLINVANKKLDVYEVTSKILLDLKNES